MRILILEDSFTLQQQLVAIVDGMGHEAIAAYDAIEAIAVLKEIEIDAIITDIFVKKGESFVPEGGLSLLSSVRTRRGSDLKVSRDVPILAISGGLTIPGGFSPLRAARDLGADHWLAKPFKVEDIESWIMGLEHGMRAPP